jgi:hypothetical protein
VASAARQLVAGEVGWGELGWLFDAELFARGLGEPPEGASWGGYGFRRSRVDRQLRNRFFGLLVTEAARSADGPVDPLIQRWIDAVEAGEDVQLEDNHGMGGSATFRVVLGAGVTLGLHLRLGVPSDDVAEQRFNTAAEMFVASGLTPRRLLAGDRWFVDVWGGSCFVENFHEINPALDLDPDSEACTLSLLGELLGRCEVSRASLSL